VSRYHTCHAVNCAADVPPRLHMCPPHWQMVPKSLQRALWAACVPGQERRMDPTAEYMQAAAACVRSVAEQEGQPPADIDFECEMYEAWAEMVEQP